MRHFSHWPNRAAPRIVRVMNDAHNTPDVDVPPDALADFVPRTCASAGTSHTVYVSGSGPAVVVLAEMPGISPHVARFARWVRDAGFTVYLPSLFGVDGAWPRADAGLAVLKRACVSAEFQAFARNANSPATQWLRALARLAHDECGGRGVGAVGMCFTGNFALGMMLEPAVIAPVLCQPSLPLDDTSAIALGPDEAAAVKERLEREDLTVRAYRFDGDRYCTAQRFAAYATALGDRFVPTVLPSSSAHPEPPPFFAQVIGCAHSVVTAHLIDAAGEPTLQARDDIIAFLSLRLNSTACGRIHIDIHGVGGTPTP
jgi:dienelactone hydrolase